MIKQSAALAALIALAIWSSVLAQAVPASETHYQTLLAAAKAGGQPVDWQALRFAYADSPEFDLGGVRSVTARKAMFQALNAGDYKGALTQAQQIIDQDYTDVDAHVVSDLAYQHLGEVASAQREHAIALGILKSIRTGDGATAATAFTVINVGEEYETMRAFNLKVTAQALIRDSNHSYDRLDVVDGDGKPHSFYFLIDRVLAAEAAAFTPKQ